MMEANGLKLSLHNDCAYNGSDYFHVRVILPLSLVDELMATMQKTRTLCGMSFELFDGEEQDGEFVWLSGRIDNCSLTFEARQGGIQLDMNCEKQAYGDEALDSYAWRQTQQGKLPDAFWIEPAAILRKLLALAATKH